MCLKPQPIRKKSPNGIKIVDKLDTEYRIQVWEGECQIKSLPEHNFNNLRQVRHRGVLYDKHKFGRRTERVPAK